MSNAGSGEWFADSDGQWTWRQPDGSCWRQAADGTWNQFAAAASALPAPPHPGPPPLQGLAQKGSFPVGGGSSALLEQSVPEGTLHLDHFDQHHGHLPEDGVHHDFSQWQPEEKLETNPLALWALFLGIFCLFYVGSVFAILLGLEARHQIKHHHHIQRGTTPALLGVLFGIAWLCTIPLLVIVGIDIYHGARTTVQDGFTTKTMEGVLTGVNDLYKVSNSYASIQTSKIPNIPLVHFVSSCGTQGICTMEGSDTGYTYFEMCEVSGSHHAWIISQTSGGSAWYGEVAGDCPVLGDPGSSTSQPSQTASWRQGGFPVNLDITVFGHHLHWKL